MIGRVEEQSAGTPSGDRLILLASRNHANRIASGLRKTLTTQTAAAGTTRTYMDTADGRLGAQAMRLSTVREGRRSRVTWESADATQRVLRLAGTPGLATELPAGPFREALAGVIAERRLLPVARVHEPRGGLDVVDNLGKTVARVRFEQWFRASKEGGEGPLLLRVSSVRGFRKAFEQTLSAARKVAGPDARPAADPWELLGLTPADAKAPVRLQPEMMVGEAARRLLRAQLDVMRANETGTRNATDPEFLHEYRVAIRRTRVALSRFRGVFPAARTERFKRDFRWLGGVSGPARDTDVYLLELPKYEASLGTEAAAHLAPLRPYLEDRCTKAYAALRRAMDSQRYRRLMADWRTFLDQPVAERTRLEVARTPVGEYANTAIWKAHRRVLKDGRAIHDATPDQAVHDLRLRCKKLRYLLEFFRSLYPNTVVRAQIKALKRLQEVLGEFNDLSVQQESLMETASGMNEQGVATLETVVAMGRLVETLGSRQHDARRRFGARFEAFASQKNRARARKLFRPGS